MEIINVPKEFQPDYKSDYPCYTSGKNMEEILYDIILKNKEIISTSMVYLPVFWTSYYVTHNYGNNIDNLYKWLETLDKEKKYFTIVQCAFGIFVKNFDLNITVFSAGGGGLNINNSNCIKEINYYGFTRSIFFGNNGDYNIPLICLPIFESLSLDKDIYCSFMGRYDTHKCRTYMKNVLENDDRFKFYNSVNYDSYKNILNRSIFTLAPRGFGYTSFRIYEAIHSNSIPIYIWDDIKVLPYLDEINWEDFCIIINTSELHNLKDILKNVDIQKMQKKLSEVKRLFTFENISNYIFNKIKKV